MHYSTFAAAFCFSSMRRLASRIMRSLRALRSASLPSFVASHLLVESFVSSLTREVRPYLSIKEVILTGLGAALDAVLELDVGTATASRRLSGTVKPGGGWGVSTVQGRMKLILTAGSEPRSRRISLVVCGERVRVSE